MITERIIGKKIIAYYRERYYRKQAFRIKSTNYCRNAINNGSCYTLIAHWYITESKNSRNARSLRYTYKITYHTNTLI